MAAQLVLWVTIKSEENLHISCTGCGLFGSSFMPALHQLPQLFLPTNNREAEWTNTYLEKIWHSTFDEETFGRAVSEWVAQMLTIYYKQTETALDRQMEYEKSAAEAVLTGKRTNLQPAHVREQLYNTKLAPRQITSRNWTR